MKSSSYGDEESLPELAKMTEKTDMDEPFLHPIDEPSDPAIKQAYQNMKQYFG